MSSSQSAVVERSRRLTAGKRMSSLVGEALDNDEAFWNHETWAEDGEDADSFRESDEDSDVRKDEFDSDFNDSETDNEAEDQAAGDEEERRLQRDEKIQRRQKTLDVAKAGRELLQKKKGKIKGNRIFGDGVNAGLVLKFPPTLASLSSGAHPPSSATTAHADSLPATATVAAIPPALTALPPVKPVPSAKVVKCTLASTRPRRGKKALRTTTLAQSVSSEGGKLVGRAPATTSKRKQHRFTQEELLLEAATETEPENARWLLARKRLHQQEEATRAAMSTASAHTKLLQRYIRKRVRYKDPKTKMGYYDLAAFKELRRRYDAGEPLQQGLVERKEAEVPCLKPETAVASQAPLVVQVAQVANGVASINNTGTSSPMNAQTLVTMQDPSRKLTMKTRNAAKQESPMEEVLSAETKPVTSNAANRLPQEPLAAGQVKEHPPTATFAAKAPAPSDCKPQTIALFSSIETENNNREERTTTASTHAQDLTKPAVTDVPAKEKGTRRSRAAHSTGNRALTSATCVQSNAAVDVASIVVTATSATCKTLQSEPNEALSHGMESNLASAGCKPIATAAEAPVESMAQLPGEAPICDKRAAAISTGPPDESASTPQTTKRLDHVLIHWSTQLLQHT
ncbi:YL1 nuclear protein [Fragilaria crotonensis]|nr:YL1 nuclear protein [Fragilaria crotonensis]